MKKALISFLTLFSVSIYAQVKGEFVLDWKPLSTVVFGQATIRIPQFSASYMVFQDRKLSFSASVAVSSAVDEKSLQLSNVLYEEIPASELGDLDKASIPTRQQVSVMNVRARNERSVSIALSPILKEGGGFKKLKSFSYSLNNPSATVAARGLSSLSNSLLQSGDWYRFYVEKSGVYKITKSFLQSLGMKLGGVDPHRIHIYGGGGRMLPLSNAVFYPDDLAENAVFFEGEADGSFDGQDYILLYAEGVDNWSEENATHNNLYADRSYYYVSIQPGNGKRITAMPDFSSVSGPFTNISIFDDYQYHERDLVNIAHLGRKWFGEDFSVDDEQSFEFEIPNFVAGSQVSIQVAAAAAAYTTTTMEVKANGTSIGNLSFASLNVSGTEGEEAVVLGNIAAAQQVAVDITYNNNGVPGSKANLDYITLQSKRTLKGYGKQFRFTYNDAATTAGYGDFQFTTAATIPQVWDITDIYNVSSVTNNAQANFSFRAPLGEIRKYIALDTGDYYSPKKESRSKVANQNLKGTIFMANGQFRDIDYLIITPASFSSAAEKLAAFHRSYSGMNVKVVALEAIYPEFSSGKQDIGAIRNFIKYVYNNASQDSKRVRYVNLFGDASFDFKDRIGNNTNFVPIYHTLSSFSLSGSFISDDFFVLMDDNEGSMQGGSQGLDIAVGRMPVDNLEQANEMVNKVIEYHDPKSFGRWRNNFVLISDDVDQPIEVTLETGLDALGDQISAQKPFINVEKIHSDAYVQEASAGGNRYPKVNEDFVKAFNKGALVFNYFGHGGEEGLAAERILDKSNIDQLNNRYMYPLFITITCEFSRFDNPSRETAGEHMFWNKAGGAIALVTTTRQIFISTGAALNQAFSANLFGYGTNSPDSIAEALRRSKASSGSNPLMVFCIGDPAVKLAIPKPSIVLTKVNDAPISGVVDDFKALSTIKLSGEIRDESGNSLLGDYDGELAVTVYDKKQQKTTLSNDSETTGVITMNFEILGETLFRGNAMVNDGLFDVSFVVPRDVRVPLGNGRVSFYAKKSGTLLNQTGYNTAIKVGGINENAEADTTGPAVKLYMNDETFVSGGITNESPILLAILEDEHGINTASGIGHDITGILDGDESTPYIMNDYYDADPGDYTKGRLRFPLRDLAKGLHTLTFKAWDVYNNPVTAEIQFLVVGDDTLTLTHILNYPNPFVGYTQFWFTHNKPFEPLEVQVQVMTVTGKVVWTHNQTVLNDGFLSRDISWDGKDDFGDRIGKGVYIYKLTVRSTLSNKRSEKFEKLVIL